MLLKFCKTGRAHESMLYLDNEKTYLQWQGKSFSTKKVRNILRMKRINRRGINKTELY